MPIAEQKALFAPCSNLSYFEAFEMLDNAGVDCIEWNEKLNREYMQWIYTTIK